MLWINFINDWNHILKQSCGEHSVKGLKVRTRYVLYPRVRMLVCYYQQPNNATKRSCEGCKDCRLRAGGLWWPGQSSDYVSPTTTPAEQSALVEFGPSVKQRCAMCDVFWINSFDMTYGLHFSDGKSQRSQLLFVCVADLPRTKNCERW